MDTTNQNDEFETVKLRFRECYKKAEGIVEGARKKIKVSVGSRFSIRLQNKAMGQGALTSTEKSQIEHFLIKYQELPEFKEPSLIEDNGKFVIDNLEDIKHFVSAFRPIIWNKGDSVYYNNIYKNCAKKLNLNDPTIGTTITVFNDKKENITELYFRSLKNNRDAIKYILDSSECDYIYNGVLQHSDERFSKRHTQDYYTGELNYLLVLHAVLLAQIELLLMPFYECCRILYPDLKLGHL